METSQRKQVVLYNISPCITVFWIGMRSDVYAQHYEEQSEAVRTRDQRSTFGHARVGRATLGGGLTIDTLPHNMTHLVVSGAAGSGPRRFV